MPTTKLPEEITFTPKFTDIAVTLRTKEEVEAFARTEQTFWKEAVEIVTGNSQARLLQNGIWNATVTRPDGILQYIETIYDQNRPEQERDKAFRHLTNSLKSYEDQVLYSSTTLAHHARNLVKEFPQVGIALLEIMFETPFRISSINDNDMRQMFVRIESQIAAYLFEHRISGSPIEDRGVFEGLQSDFRSQVERCKELIAEFETNLEGWAKKHQQQHGLEAAWYEKKKEEISTDFEETKVFYKRELENKAPVEYWRNKQTGHLIAALVTFFLFVGAAFCSYYFLDNKVADLMEKMVPTSTGNSSLMKDSAGMDPAEPQPRLEQQQKTGSLKNTNQDIVNTSSRNADRTFLIVLVGAGAFIAIWILRLVSRVFLMNLHAYSDAGERVAMVKVYLAMMEHRPDTVSEQDRILILNALFRPGTGAGTDDGAPPHWFDILTNRMKSNQPG